LPVRSEDGLAFLTGLGRHTSWISSAVRKPRVATSTFYAHDGSEYEIFARRHRRGVGGAEREHARNRELQIALKLGQQSPPHLLTPLAWRSTVTICWWWCGISPWGWMNSPKPE
jgi:hypothetical protein